MAKKTRGLGKIIKLYTKKMNKNKDEEYNKGKG